MVIVIHKQNEKVLGDANTAHWLYSDAVSNSSLVVNGQSVEKVSSCKYLGLIIDDEPNWRLHIENIYTKLVKYTIIFYKL